MLKLLEPAAPVEPRGPVAPAIPGVPGLPVAPVVPGLPVEPCGPVAPARPVVPGFLSLQLFLLRLLNLAVQLHRRDLLCQDFLLNLVFLAFLVVLLHR